MGPWEMEVRRKEDERILDWILREGWRLWGGLEEEGTEAVDSSGVSLELCGASS